MREAGHGEHGNDRAVVRQRVHAAAGHRGDPMQHLRWNARGVCILEEGIGHRCQCDTQPPGSGARHAGEQIHGNGFIDQRMRNGFERIRDDAKPRQRGDDAAEAKLRGGIHGAKESAGDGRFGPFGKFVRHGLPGKDEHGGDAGEERPADRQIGAILAISCVTGGTGPRTAGTNEWVAPYNIGIFWVKT